MMWPTDTSCLCREEVSWVSQLTVAREQRRERKTSILTFYYRDVATMQAKRCVDGHQYLVLGLAKADHWRPKMEKGVQGWREGRWTGGCEDGKFDLLRVILHWRSREEAMVVRQSGNKERDNNGGWTWKNYTVVAGRPDAHTSQIRSNMCDWHILYV